MPGIPHDTIDKLAGCFASLSALGAELYEEEWKAPTELPGWSVQDNLSHLVAIERVLEGLPATEHRATDLSVAKNPIGEHNEHEVDARRALPGSDVLAEWNAIADRRLATLRSADESYFDEPTMTPTGPGTLADFLHIRVLDCWVHEQDMRRAVGRPGHLEGPAAEHTIDRLIRTVPIVVGKRAVAPEGALVIVDIDGPVVRNVRVQVEGGRARVLGANESSDIAPLAVLSLDSEAFLVLATGRRTAAELAGRWRTSGDDALATKVAEQLNMMI
jgi:uncharacterized protein (TIGR03083 family)